MPYLVLLRHSRGRLIHFHCSRIFLLRCFFAASHLLHLHWRTVLLSLMYRFSNKNILLVYYIVIRLISFICACRLFTTISTCFRWERWHMAHWLRSSYEHLLPPLFVIGHWFLDVYGIVYATFITLRNSHSIFFLRFLLLFFWILLILCMCMCCSSYLDPYHLSRWKETWTLYWPVPMSLYILILWLRYV
jgi:hypothetical protein